jgi:hypothetical protein
VTRKPAANHLRKRAPNAERDKIDAADTTDAQLGAKTKALRAQLLCLRDYSRVMLIIRHPNKLRIGAELNIKILQAYFSSLTSQS